MADSLCLSYLSSSVMLSQATASSHLQGLSIWASLSNTCGNELVLLHTEKSHTT